MTTNPYSAMDQLPSVAVEIIDLGNERPTTGHDGNANASGEEDGTSDDRENRSNKQQEDTNKKPGGDNDGSK